MAENGIEARDDFAVAFVADVDGSSWARGLYSERLADVTSATPYTRHLRARLQGACSRPSSTAPPSPRSGSPATARALAASAS